MANTYTSNVKLAMPSTGDTGWSVPVNSNCTTLDNMNPVGDLAVTTKEVPSSSLNVAVSGGQYINQDGSISTFAGSTSQAITASTTAVLYLDLTSAGALTVAGSYPTTPHVRLATVVAGGSSLSSVSDNRQCFNVVGSWADGVNITLGTTTGTKIGTSTGQKLSFWGATAVVRPTMGSATAGASYTSNEQTMIQTMWNLLRTIGLGS